jgi:hypothetical protein
MSKCTYVSVLAWPLFDAHLHIRVWGLYKHARTFNEGLRSKCARNDCFGSKVVKEKNRVAKLYSISCEIALFQFSRMPPLSHAHPK